MDTAFVLLGVLYGLAGVGYIVLGVALIRDGRREIKRAKKIIETLS